MPNAHTLSQQPKPMTTAHHLRHLERHIKRVATASPTLLAFEKHCDRCQACQDLDRAHHYAGEWLVLYFLENGDTV